MAFIFMFHACIPPYLLHICGTGRIKFIQRLVNQLCIGDNFQLFLSETFMLKNSILFKQNGIALSGNFSEVPVLIMGIPNALFYFTLYLFLVSEGTLSYSCSFLAVFLTVCAVLCSL